MLPKGDEYVGALQHPNIAFRDPDLRIATIETTRSGLPKPYSGGFNMVFHAQTPRGDWAIRCFTRDVSEVLERYDAITRFLNTCSDNMFIRAKLIRDEILVRGQRHHIVKMEWDRGLQLDKYIELCINDSAKRCKQRLQALADQIMMLGINLDRLGIAHGDLSHSNIRVTSAGRFRLIDYDDMFLPQLSHLKLSSGLGHQSYQHPKRTSADFSETMDRFSLFVLYTSLVALANDRTLWQRYDGGDDCVLFRRGDFAAPKQSKLFQELSGAGSTAKWADRLAAVSTNSYGSIPSLYQFIDGTFPHDTRSAAATTVTRPASSTAPPRFKSAAAPPPAPPPPASPPPTYSWARAAASAGISGPYTTSGQPQSAGVSRPKASGRSPHARYRPNPLLLASVFAIVLGMVLGYSLERRLHPAKSLHHRLKSTALTSHSLAPRHVTETSEEKIVSPTPTVAHTH